MLPTILFLDDSEPRHKAFKERVQAAGYLSRFQIVYAYTAKYAIETLDKYQDNICQAFLDHDLDEADTLCKVGAKTKAPTGMTVVDHIVKMQRPPRAVIVHSLNYVAALEMCTRLKSVPSSFDVFRIPFHELLNKFM
jgi:hypothetical protein